LSPSTYSSVWQQAQIAVGMQAVVIDARGHMLGRLASIIAKQALSGHQVVSAIAASLSVTVFPGVQERINTVKPS
jgi:ribosomal protein L13